MEARNAIQHLRQAKGQMAAEFAQNFKDIGDQTGLSDVNLQECFHSSLNPEI
ncbi:hypothetical protein J3R30DRAFT_3515075 [Lentinula aciculospora]|uniref:Retrotransposon gag domain-containing protein n=1 Tax=Lentinula aciculospora TaxID=153920 RepID=A0A9W9A2T9_9AGAR|nr:hypothetical protein J3R30DRAFT_3515075 [Lentinula aciculospora]